MGKTILDIRYYASDIENISGKSLPSSCSKYFAFPKELHFWGSRIARRLENLGLSVGSFDHVYINYTSVLPEHTIQISERSPEPWLRYVDYGVSYKLLNELSPLELENFIIESTFKSLSVLCADDDEKLNKLNSVKYEVEKFGTELEIEAKRKETKSYSVVVSYKVNPSGASSCGLIDYKNIKNGQSFKRKFIELKSYSDIYPLIGSITIKDGKIILKPRKSFKASLYTNTYTVPIEVAINEKENA